MKKKSKFQERLDEIAKNYTPEEDRGSINDKLNLHDMDNTIDDEVSQTQTSQTAQDPDYVKRYSLKDVEALIQRMEEEQIPDRDMPEDPNQRDGHYGFNFGIQKCIDLLKRVNRETKAKDLK